MLWRQMILLNMIMVYLILKIFTLIHQNISEQELKVNLLNNLCLIIKKGKFIRNTKRNKLQYH